MIISFTYTIRGQSPMQDENRNFFLQTFGAEKTQLDIHAATDTLLTSCDMRGQGGNYTGASYQRLNYLTFDCKQIFSGQEQHIPEFIQEEEIPGQG